MEDSDAPTDASCLRRLRMRALESADTSVAVLGPPCLSRVKYCCPKPVRSPSSASAASMAARMAPVRISGWKVLITSSPVAGDTMRITLSSGAMGMATARPVPGSSRVCSRLSAMNTLGFVTASSRTSVSNASSTALIASTASSNTLCPMGETSAARLSTAGRTRQKGGSGWPVARSGMIPSGRTRRPSASNSAVTMWYPPSPRTWAVTCVRGLPLTLTRVQSAHSDVPSSSHDSGSTMRAS